MSSATRPLSSGIFHFSGSLGSRIDTAARGRLTDPEVLERVYPEVEEAFRARIDDKLKPAAGTRARITIGGDAGAAYELRAADGCTLQLLPFDRLGATWDRALEFNSWTVT